MLSCCVPVVVVGNQGLDRSGQQWTVPSNGSMRMRAAPRTQSVSLPRTRRLRCFGFAIRLVYLDPASRYRYTNGPLLPLAGIGCGISSRPRNPLGHPLPSRATQPAHVHRDASLGAGEPACKAAPSSTTIPAWYYGRTVVAAAQAIPNIVTSAQGDWRVRVDRLQRQCG